MAPAPFTAPVAQHPARKERTRRSTKAVEAPLAPPSIPVYQPSAGGGASDGGVDEVSGGVTAPAEPPITADPVTDDATEPLVPVADPPATTGDGSGSATGGETAPAAPADEIAAPAAGGSAPPPPGNPEAR